ncbi:protein L-isoaspartate methyltransferase [Sulfolobus acidocaldarius SUSAZ]|nr:protein L-isoaspartate methyltransferase [Sulfolobus acidocaldarius SUSAZ]
MPLNEGDPVVIWVDPKRIYLVKLIQNKVFSTDKGYIDLGKLIGLEYGSEILLSTGIKAYLLKPTPIDLYRGLKRLSQVLYPKDIGYIIYSSGVQPGSTVVEAGTGSGFLTLSLAYFLGNSTKIVTYDVREDMQDIAKRNASYLGLSDRIIFKLKDIREGIEEVNVDAIFLDMPDPWNAMETVRKALKPSGSLIIFVPTVNQIEKVIPSLTDFVDVHAEELIIREYQMKENAVRPRNIGVIHTGYIIRGRKRIKVS